MPLLCRCSRLLLLAGSILVALAAPSAAQVRIVREVTITGTLASVGEGRIEVRDEKGKLHPLKIQTPGASGVMLDGGRMLRFRSDVRVVGERDLRTLDRGAGVRLNARVNQRGEVEGPVDQVNLVDVKEDQFGIRTQQPPEDGVAFADCEVTGKFMRASRGRLVLSVGKNDFMRKKSLTIPLGEDARVQTVSRDYRTAAAGAEVEKLVVAVLNSGERLVRQLRVRVAADTEAEATFAGELRKKYKSLSNEPVDPRLVRSRHFLFQTDLSDRESRVLLDKLEVMVELLSKYFGASPTGTVQGYLVRDLKRWPPDALPNPQGVAKIREKAGVGFSKRLGRQYSATVYAYADHGVVQHECTHAFCTMTFGSTGPTWLAEGVAEMGQYWRVDDTAVKLPAAVLNYLKKAPKRELGEIAVPGKGPAGDYRDYAWRWVLCHLLAYNSNYSEHFKPLAIDLMRRRQGSSFANTYGPFQRQISFEYDLFIKELDNGYDAELCRWQWERSFAPLNGSRAAKTKVLARAGWQASGVRVAAGEAYDLRAEGEWRVVPQGEGVSADGEPDGRGRLVGAVLQDFRLSEEFELGASASFTPPAGGDLYLRCRDEWGALADNDGEVKVAIRSAE